MSIPSRNDIYRGVMVAIETKEEQGTGTFTEGIVDEILTRNNRHPYGIKVRLQDGHVGRVKKLLEVMSVERCSKPNKNKIPKVEDKYNEFKEFFQYDESMNKIHNIAEKSKSIEGIKRTVQERFAQAICSFGNDRAGGTIYLGIKSDGTISGLEQDKNLQGLANYDDEFANHIRTSLEKFFDDKVFLTAKIDLKFKKINDKTICIVHVMPSDTPLYLKSVKGRMFFVRGFAPRAEKLDNEDQVRYIRERFPHYR